MSNASSVSVTYVINIHVFSDFFRKFLNSVIE